MNPPPKITFGCCFCGQGDATHGLVLTTLDGEFEQQWWCHPKCLINHMTPTAADAAAYEYYDNPENREPEGGESS